MALRKHALLTSMLLAACAPSPNAGPGGELGVFEPADAAVQATAADSGKVLVPTGVVEQQEDLRARIQSLAGLTLDVLTVSCAGECADVMAEAHGGNPPYHIQWEDGSTEVTRHVCPKQSGELELAVTDTAIKTVEFGYDAHTAAASVTTQVLACPTQADAGMPAADSGTATDAAMPPTVDPSQCQEVLVDMTAAESCQPLTLDACPSVDQDSPIQIHANVHLPHGVGPLERSCVVAFAPSGDMRDRLNALSFASANAECVSNGDGLLRSGSQALPMSLDQSLWQVLCLDSQLLPYDMLFLESSFISGLNDLELRFCERCPTRP